MKKILLTEIVIFWFDSNYLPSDLNFHARGMLCLIKKYCWYFLPYCAVKLFI